MGEIFKKRTIRDLILEEKHDHEIGYVNYFNDGSVVHDKYLYGKLMKIVNNSEGIKNIENALLKASVSYGYYDNYNFDSIKMNLLLGLVYKISDVDENNNIKEGAKPIDNIVRFYTHEINSYLNGEQANECNYLRNSVGYQGYLKYNEFVKSLSDLDMEYSGPENFEEFKKQVLSKVPFEVSLNVDLKEDKDLELKRKY